MAVDFLIMIKQAFSLDVLRTKARSSLTKDQHHLEKAISAAQKSLNGPKGLAEAEKDKITETIERSFARAKLRLEQIPTITFPDLPVAEKTDEIAGFIRDHQVIVVAGETGSGKTTQLPKICLQLGIGARGLIGHTQPRRLAARAVANRIAEECGSKLGELIGYQVRFTDLVSDSTYVKIMTDGILLAEIKNDPYLRKYEAIIIDEAHERSLNIDFLLGYLRTLLPKRPDLKLIVTSATIDVEKFSQFFNDAPIIEVSGRTFPVTVEYRPADFLSDQDEDLNLYESIGRVMDEIEASERGSSQKFGDVLVFLSGEREIRDASKYLKSIDLPHTEVLPLYARLTANEQNRIFQSHKGRRIVLSTNVAETSITVPGIRYVIDSGVARVSRYSYRSKVQRLPVEAISQASANQRAGRCGRVAEGVCYRLFSEEDFLSRDEFTDPEITRTNLASVILQMASLRLGDIRKFPFLQSPDSRLVNDGYKLLHELGAVDGRRQLTEAGRTLARIPADPKLARMLIEAGKENSLREVLIIISALASQDPRDKPQDKKQAADQAHQQFAHKESDFLSFVSLWEIYEVQRQELSTNQLRKYCQKNFISFMRMREWRDIHRQLHIIVKQIGLKENAEPATYEQIHIALLSGLLGNVGEKSEKNAYKGTRNRIFYPFPGSALFKKGPKWLMAAELVETSKIYGRVLARIEAEWIEPLAKSVVKYSHFEPHWEEKRGQVIGFEEVRLYGLIIIAKRKVNYARIDAPLCRELFIRHGLVYGEIKTKAPFYLSNQSRIAEVAGMEDKFRRKDLLVDEETLFRFYDQKIPEGVVSKVHFDTWWKSLKSSQMQALEMTAADVMRQSETACDESLFPAKLELGSIGYRLDYRFAPGEKSDGVTLITPLAALKQISAESVDWLVPGLVKEKCIQLIKALPKQYRKNFVPVPSYVEKILPKLSQQNGALIPQVSLQLYYLSGVRVPLEAWDGNKLESHLKMNVRVVNERQETLFESRNLDEIIERFGDEDLQQAAIQEAASDWSAKGLTSWSFVALPEFVIANQMGMEVRMYPYLSDERSSVVMSVSTDPQYANTQSLKGISRLIALQLSTQLEHTTRTLKHFKQTALLYAPVGKASQLADDFLIALIKNHFLSEGIPRNKGEYDAIVERHRSTLFDAATAFDELVYSIFRRWHESMKMLKRKNINLQLATYMSDVKFQLDKLVYSGFLVEAPGEWLLEFPRYLDAVAIRLEKMPREMASERQFSLLIKSCWDQYHLIDEGNKKKGKSNVELITYRWMLEEFRVSWFAQQLGTKMTVSDKRLAKQWQLVQQAQLS